MSNRIFETDEYVVEELEHCYNIMQFKSKLCMDVIVIPKQIMKDIAEKVLIDELTEAGKEIIQRGNDNAKKNNTVRRRSKKSTENDVL